MSLDSVTIIIRSVGERTESLCRKLIIDQGVDARSIFLINEAPFSKAMKVAFEIGIAENRSWTFCVDADLLLRPQSIVRMIEHAEKQPPHVCEIQGFVLDKFFGGPRKGGVHVYRTSLLHKVIDLIPLEGKNIRPETYVLNEMRVAGYPWLTVRELVGLHDFEQAYGDIFRKCFVHAHKHLNDAELFIPFWRSNSSHDIDYKIALIGFAEGIKHFGEVRIDKKAQYFQGATQYLGASPQRDVDLSKWNLDRIESMIKTWVEPPEYWENYPGGILWGSGASRVFRRALAQYKRHRRRGSVKVAWLQVIGWLLIGAGKKVRSHNNLIR